MIRALALLLFGALPAWAAPLETLVEERALAVYGDRLPPEGVFDITVSTDPGAPVTMLAEFWMDLDTGQFLTNAVTEAGDVRRLSGLALVTVPVPVPTRRMLPDEIVTEADLRIEQMPLGHVGGYAETDAASLVGMQVRRVLTPGRPIQSQSVREPLVVERGQRIEIRFADGTLSLAAPGRALADAHRGQDVRVVNLVSNKSVTAIAAGDGVVEIAR